MTNMSLCSGEAFLDREKDLIRDPCCHLMYPVSKLSWSGGSIFAMTSQHVPYPFPHTGSLGYM
jgi:hypothetical protein